MNKTILNSFVFYSLCLCLLSNFFVHNSALAQRIQIIVPQQIENSPEKGEILTKEFFINYPFVSETVSLEQFQKRNPNADLPESISIKLPDMTGIQDTSLLIGFLNNPAERLSYLVVLVVGDYESNAVTFFADTNFDHNYRNDEAPFVLVGGASPKTIFLQPDGEAPLKLKLRVPKRLNPVDQKLKELEEDRKNYKEKINNRLSVSIAAGIGAGKLSYDYDNLSTGYPTWYNVRFTDKTISAIVNYDFPKFRIGINAAYLSSFYYTSYYNVRTGEPRGIRTGVLTERNIDDHSLGKLHLGATLAYKFHLSRVSSLNPFFTYGKNIYLSDSYFADNRPNKEISYTLSPDNFIEYGIQWEFTVGYQKALFVDFVINQLSWEPDNFLEGIDHENLQIKHGTWKIILGYKIAL